MKNPEFLWFLLIAFAASSCASPATVDAPGQSPTPAEIIGPGIVLPTPDGTPTTYLYDGRIDLFFSKYAFVSEDIGGLVDMAVMSESIVESDTWVLRAQVNVESLYDLAGLIYRTTPPSDKWIVHEKFQEMVPFLQKEADLLWHIQSTGDTRLINELTQAMNDTDARVLLMWDEWEMWRQ